jgi:hypothetical protein
MYCPIIFRDVSFICFVISYNNINVKVGLGTKHPKDIAIKERYK